jgi:hypothetical protein
MAKPTDPVQGTLDMLILKLIFAGAYRRPANDSLVGPSS